MGSLAGYSSPSMKSLSIAGDVSREVSAKLSAESSERVCASSMNLGLSTSVKVLTIAKDTRQNRPNPTAGAIC